MKLYKILFEEIDQEPVDMLDETARMIEREIAEVFDLSPSSVRLDPISADSINQFKFYGTIRLPDEQNIPLTFTFAFIDTLVELQHQNKNLPPVPFKPTLPDPNTPPSEIKTPAEQFAAAMRAGLLVNDSEWVATHVVPAVEDLVFADYAPTGDNIGTVLTLIPEKLGYRVNPKNFSGTKNFSNTSIFMLSPTNQEWNVFFNKISVANAVMSLRHNTNNKARPVIIRIPVKEPLAILFLEAGADPELLDRIANLAASYVKPHLTP